MTENEGGTVVRKAVWPQDEPAAVSLLQDYLGFLRNNFVMLEQQHIESYERELLHLPSMWNGRRSALLLAQREQELLGCIGVHLLANRPGAAEIKRLWTAPAARGSGLGRLLIEAAITWAQARSARELLLDTLPGAMPDALRLYRAMGFEECERYNTNPVTGILFFRLQIG